jgi:hypothetical protein
MDAMFSIPVVVKVRCIPTARFRSFYFFYRWHTYSAEVYGLRFIIFRTDGSIQLACLNEFRKLV